VVDTAVQQHQEPAVTARPPAREPVRSGGGGGSGAAKDVGARVLRMPLGLPSDPSPAAAAVVGTRGSRPVDLLESRSVFAGGAGRTAKEFTPAASRLLSLLSARGALVEHT